MITGIAGHPWKIITKIVNHSRTMVTRTLDSPNPRCPPDILSRATVHMNMSACHPNKRPDLRTGTTFDIYQDSCAQQETRAADQATGAHGGVERESSDTGEMSDGPEVGVVNEEDEEKEEEGEGEQV